MPNARWYAISAPPFSLISCWNLARRNGKLLAGLQQHGLVIDQLGGANLGPLQVAQDAQRLALLAAHRADHLDQRQFLLVGAVGKIQANDIDACANQFPEDGHCVGGWPERGNDLCAALGGGIGKAQRWK
jgi:hypothetical protein